jgi:hypothetical protein
MPLPAVGAHLADDKKLPARVKSGVSCCAGPCTSASFTLGDREPKSEPVAGRELRHEGSPIRPDGTVSPTRDRRGPARGGLAAEGV